MAKDYIRKELYEDVLAEDPSEKEGFDIKKGFQSKAYKRWEQRLYNSIGWIQPEEHHEVMLEKSKPGKFGPIKLASSPLGSEIHWDVNLEEGGFTCKSQEHAHILSLLVQMNERLKRVGVHNPFMTQQKSPDARQARANKVENK